MKTFALVFFFSLFLDIFSIKFGLIKNLINIDYFIVVIFLILNFRKISFFLLIVFLNIDLILLFSQIFPFVQIRDLMYILKFVVFASNYYIILLLVSEFFVFFLSFIFCKVAVNKNIFLGLLVLVMLLNYFVIFLNVNILNKDFLYSGSVDFFSKQNSGLSDALNSKAKPLLVTSPQGITKDLYNQIDREKLESNKYLLIVNESWGKPKEQKVLQAIIKPILDLDPKFEFYKEDSLSWDSATIYGELRELCRAQPQNLNLKDVKEGFKYCLPNKLKLLGFHTSAYHAALGSMYDRNIWYKKTGFNKVNFFESKKWRHHCYSFPGGCDDEFILDIAKDFIHHDKAFIYWMTLNTHSSYDRRDLVFDVFNCSQYDIDPDTQSCRNFKLQAQFFYNLSKLLNRESMKGVEVFIAGDHTPPIFSAIEKNKYFDENKVVTLHFKMKK